MIPNVLRAGLQSSTIMTVADVATQTLVEGKELMGVSAKDHSSSSSSSQQQQPQNNHHHPNTSIDLTRTLRWATAGLLLHGPYFFVGFARLDALLGPPVSLTVVAQKTAAAQFVLFPPYLALLFGWHGVLEQVGRSMVMGSGKSDGSINNNNKKTTTRINGAEIIQKIQQKVPEAFLAGCAYWPVANGLNFALVPTAWRVPYLAASAGLWNCYLSWENARDAQQQQQQQPGEDSTRTSHP